MATLQSTPALRIRKPVRLCGCGDRLYVYRGDIYCPTCSAYVPSAPRPSITVSVAFECADELLQRLAACGWGIAVVGDEARLWRHDAATACDARAVLAAQGFDTSLFAVED